MTNSSMPQARPLSQPPSAFWSQRQEQLLQLAAQIREQEGGEPSSEVLLYEVAIIAAIERVVLGTARRPSTRMAQLLRSRLQDPRGADGGGELPIRLHRIIPLGEWFEQDLQQFGRLATQIWECEAHLDHPNDVVLEAIVIRSGEHLMQDIRDRLTGSVLAELLELRINDPERFMWRVENARRGYGS